MFLTTFFCAYTALKLSSAPQDGYPPPPPPRERVTRPVALRSTENGTLSVWCQGVGCVMPFTPKSCLSWCDWNVDKQSDAEGRGLLKTTSSGTANTPESYGMYWIASTEAFVFDPQGEDRCAGATKAVWKKNNFYSFRKPEQWTREEEVQKLSPAFPGADEETKSKLLYFTCNKVYVVSKKDASTEPIQTDPGTLIFRFVKPSANALTQESEAKSQLEIWDLRGIQYPGWDKSVTSLSTTQRVLHRFALGATKLVDGKPDGSQSCKQRATKKVTTQPDRYWGIFGFTDNLALPDCSAVPNKSPVTPTCAWCQTGTSGSCKAADSSCSDDCGGTGPTAC